MKIEYDCEADALFIMLKEDAQPVDTQDIQAGVTIDLDCDGNMVGIEILDAVKTLGAESVHKVTIDTMLVDQPS